MSRDYSRWALLPLCSVLATSVLAADSSIELAASSIVATFRQENVPVDAAFKNFTGTIRYDAAKPAATSAELTVDMSSLDLGDAATGAEVRTPAWFDSDRFPQATFRSVKVRPGSAGHFDAIGTLSIKGRAQTVTVSVAVLRTGRAYSFDGSFELSRRAYGIGDPS